MLEIRDLVVSYGAIEAVRGITLTAAPAAITAIVGANGAGKSTTMKAIAGLLRPVQGSIEFEGKPIGHLPAAQIVTRGIALVPEGRRVFGPMSVRENLQMGAFTRLFPRAVQGGREVEMRLAFVLETFPRLKERLAQQAATLSGGEQQMLAIGRALMSTPHMLLLDEPSMGLAPLIVLQVFDVLRKLQNSGLTVLVSEQNASVALAHADHGYVIESGRIVLADTAANLHGNDKVREAYLGI